MSANARVISNHHTGERLQLQRIVRHGVAGFALHGSPPAHQQGPPLHVHYQETEEGTVVSGRCRL
jgi:hypothetical protein